MAGSKKKESNTAWLWIIMGAWAAQRNALSVWLVQMKDRFHTRQYHLTSQHKSMAKCNRDGTRLATMELWFVWINPLRCATTERNHPSFCLVCYCCNCSSLMEQSAMGMVTLVAIIGTSILVANDSSTGTRSSNGLQWLDKDDRAPGW